MTQTQTPAPEAFPPFTQRPEAREVWRRARADYLAGDSAPVIAERYGLSERSVRRRASVEGWRRCDLEAEIAPPPHWSRAEPKSRSAYIAEHPEYGEIAAARDADAFLLLFNPEQAEFRRHAFRRAAAGAAMDRPGEAAAWLRVLRLLDQCEPMPHPHDGLFPADDHMRAAVLRAMSVWPGPDGNDDGNDDGDDNGDDDGDGAGGSLPAEGA